jgi:hypothetical protein
LIEFSKIALEKARALNKGKAAGQGESRADTAKGEAKSQAPVLVGTVFVPSVVTKRPMWLDSAVLNRYEPSIILYPVPSILVFNNPRF